MFLGYFIEYYLCWNLMDVVEVFIKKFINKYELCLNLYIFFFFSVNLITRREFKVCV